MVAVVGPEDAHVVGPLPARDVPADGAREAITVAAVQLRNRPDEPEDRRDAIETLVARAADAGAEFVALPELSHSGYVPNGTVWDLAEPMDGPSVRHVSSLARSHRVHLGAGLVLREGDDVVNAYVLADDTGEIVGMVRKRFAETYCFLTVDGSVAIDTRWGRIGLAICADNHRADTLQRVRAAGVRLHLMPHGWPMPTQVGGAVSAADLEVAAVRARDLCRVYADRLGVPVVLVNAVGPLPPMDGLLGRLMSPERFALGGLSQVATPGGGAVGPLGGEEDVLVATVELGPVDPVPGDPPTWHGWLHPGQPLLRRVLMPLDTWMGRRAYRARRTDRARHGTSPR